MKKKIIITTLLIIVISITMIIYNNYKIKPINAEKFELSNQNYKSEYKEIKSEDLKKLITKEESFVVFVYQPEDITSTNFKAVLDELIKEKSLTIYKITNEEIQKTKYKHNIKHYPSFMTFYKGKLSDYIDTEKDKEAYFKKTNEFIKWLEEKIELKENQEKTEEQQKLEELKNTKITIPDITKEKGKVNIYLFWGEGCPHCKHEKEFLNELKTTHGDMYKLYEFEVWYNAKNKETLNVFGAHTGTIVKAVPYTIIGEKTFSGFGENTKEAIKRAIEEESQKDYDIYIDKISKKEEG